MLLSSVQRTLNCAKDPMARIGCLAGAHMARSVIALIVCPPFRPSAATALCLCLPLLICMACCLHCCCICQHSTPMLVSRSTHLCLPSLLPAELLFIITSTTANLTLGSPCVTCSHPPPAYFGRQRRAMSLEAPPVPIPACSCSTPTATTACPALLAMCCLSSISCDFLGAQSCHQSPSLQVYKARMGELYVAVKTIHREHVSPQLTAQEALRTIAKVRRFLLLHAI